LNYRRLFAIIKKETTQMIRDWQTLLMIILMPVIELMLFAYVGDLTLDHLPTVVADMSRDPRSRAFISALEVSGFFDVTQYVNSENEVIRAIDEGKANVGLVIPPNFAGQIERGSGQALVIIDGSDAFVVQSGYNAAVTIAQIHGMELMLQIAGRMGMSGVGQLPIDTSTRILYNPNIDEIVFLIPGLVAMLLQLIGVNATVIAIVRERELGTMEQMLVTPTRPVELILGKIVPPIGLIVVDLLIIILLGVYWFKVPFRGSVGLFSWLSLLFIASSLGLGLLLSTIAKNQKQAQQISAVFMMLSILLTGLIYPRSTMPPIVRAVGNLMPATYFIRITRGIINKGIGLAFLWEDVLVLAVYGIIIVILSAVTFKTRLD